ncbi:DUF4180 domain-containing protein [Spirochaeta cellobiosiphila]|uniref:DUF4180 domain-containing protein n=1 Tax=Spirochaeta cellobiosiphila TaxID=504483 RepID=UPI0003F5E285|nr:DUF4180 domain-containing protein [Spirochaeta cellobiosiphila]
MNIEVINTAKGDLSRAYLSEEDKIITTSDFLSVLMSCPTNTIVLNDACFSPDFFDLKTKLAGEFLQKVSNYRKRLIILGDFAKYQSPSFNDFIYESNLGGNVIFTKDIAEGIHYLK